MDIELALTRLTQLETRICTTHPKAAHDGQLASIISSLRDTLTEAQDARQAYGIHSHDGYIPHSHEVRADHRGVVLEG